MLNQLIFSAVFILLGWMTSVIAIKHGYERKQLQLFPSQRKEAAIVLSAMVVMGFSAWQLWKPLSVLNILQLIILLILIHASITDILSLQIFTKPILITLTIMFIFNLILFMLGQPHNLLSGALAAILMFGIITITKEKGMGEGDLLIFVLMGLALSIGQLIVSFYIMVFAGSIVGLTIAGLKHKLHGLKIPFVPFMTLGFCVAIICGNLIVTAYLATFNIIL